MYLALLYDVTDDYLERRGEFRAEHLARAQAESQAGHLLLGGAFADPADHALLIWDVPDRSVVEQFVDADPYVRAGLVTRWQIREWTVVVGSAAG